MTVVANDTPNPGLAFLGVGWAFPVGVGPDGAILKASYEDDVTQAILIILQTNPGERIMRPDFGAGLNDFVFKPMNQDTMERVKDRVQRALTAWEPRIDILDITVETGDEANVLLIDMSYQVRATNTRLNLVYPFYLQEGNTQ
jgi:phage baseplate assembly protein W